MNRYYEIAGLNVLINSVNPLGETLCDYFKNEEKKNSANKLDLVISVVDRPEDLQIKEKYRAVSGKFQFNAEEFFVRDKDFHYTVKNLFGVGTTEVKILWTRKKNLKNFLKDCIGYQTIGSLKYSKKFLEKILNYSFFWYIMALVLLKNNKCFVHSSIFGDHNCASVVVGSAGCGKTSTLLKAMEKPECCYVGEDFGILGSDGYAYYIAKKVTVYEEDAAFGSEIIKAALDKLKICEKKAWDIFGLVGINVRYKFQPEIIFPGHVEKFMKIGTVTFVSRTSVEKPIKHKISEEMMIEKIMSASFREIKVIYELLNNIRAVGDEEILEKYPSVSSLEEQYRVIMREILRKCEAFDFVETPFKAGPVETLACIREGLSNG